MVFFHTQIRCFGTSVYCFIFEMHFIPIWYEKMDDVWNWWALSPTRALLLSPKGVRRLEMATDARSRGVQGHVVRSSIVVSPGGKVWKMCPRYETSPQRYENKNLKVWKKFLQGMKFLYRSMGMEKVFIFLRVWNYFWEYEKVSFGFEENPIFAKKYFHTLGYENIGCFSLMCAIRFPMHIDLL